MCGLALLGAVACVDTSECTEDNSNCPSGTQCYRGFCQRICNNLSGSMQTTATCAINTQRCVCVSQSSATPCTNAMTGRCDFANDDFCMCFDITDNVCEPKCQAGECCCLGACIPRPEGADPNQDACSTCNLQMSTMP